MVLEWKSLNFKWKVSKLTNDIAVGFGLETLVVCGVILQLALKLESISLHSSPLAEHAEIIESFTSEVTDRGSANFLGVGHRQICFIHF